MTTLASERTYRSLRDLVQSYISDLPGQEGDGLVVVVPEKERVDVYSSHASGVPTDTNALIALPWIVASSMNRSWRGRFVTEHEKLEIARLLGGT